MNHNDREHFWQTLCSLPGNDIVAEREQLFKAIKYPKLLFRYRPVSTKSLDALRTNNDYRLHYETADYDGMDPQWHNSWSANGRSRGKSCCKHGKRSRNQKYL